MPSLSRSGAVTSSPPARTPPVPAPTKIDAHTARTLRSLLAACDPGRQTIVDFSAVTLCGAAGIHVLLEAHARHERHGGSLRVAHVRPEVCRMFTLTHTAGLLDTDTRP